MSEIVKCGHWSSADGKRYPVYFEADKVPPEFAAGRVMEIDITTTYSVQADITAKPPGEQT